GRGPGVPLALPDPFGTAEIEATYPEPTMFGTLPAYGMYVRHARRVTMDHVDLSVMKGDARPPFMLYDVAGAHFEHVTAQAAANVPGFMLNHVTDFSTERCTGVADLRRESVDAESITGTGVPAPGSTYTPAAPADHLPPSANTPIPTGRGRGGAPLTPPRRTRSPF